MSEEHKVETHAAPGVCGTRGGGGKTAGALAPGRWQEPYVTPLHHITMAHQMAGGGNAGKRTSNTAGEARTKCGDPTLASPLYHSSPL